MTVELPIREATRLSDFDYSTPGAYFVTVCTQNRAKVFGEILDGKMILNENGEIVEKYWLDINRHFANVRTDEFVIMPDHFHGIVFIQDPKITQSVGDGSPVPFAATRKISPGDDSTTGAETAPLRPVVDWSAKRPTLGQIIGYFKYKSTKRINETRKTPGAKLWQRSFYDHVIRTDEDLATLRDYILNNPLELAMDFNPRAVAEEIERNEGVK